MVSEAVSESVAQWQSEPIITDPSTPEAETTDDHPENSEQIAHEDTGDEFSPTTEVTDPSPTDNNGHHEPETHVSEDTAEHQQPEGEPLCAEPSSPSNQLGAVEHDAGNNETKEEQLESQTSMGRDLEETAEEANALDANH